MKKYLIISILILGAGAGVIGLIAQNNRPATPPPASQAQTPFLTPEEKRELKKNLVIKEYNSLSNGKRKWLDHLTVWDENGYKLEDIEYAAYGQRERTTYEYDDMGRCTRENVYNDKNKLYRIRKYEYLSNGRKKIQYNYNPDGKLYSIKTYEYSFR